MGNNGLYLLNCNNRKGGERSGIAYYDSLFGGTDGHDTNAQPQAFVYTDVSGDTIWETNQEGRATFSSNVTFTWKIDADAQSKPQDAVVGTGSNGAQDFTIHKDNNTFLFTNDDGFDCFRVYWVN